MMGSERDSRQGNITQRPCRARGVAICQGDTFAYGPRARRRKGGMPRAVNRPNFDVSSRSWSATAKGPKKVSTDDGQEDMLRMYRERKR